MPVQRCSLIKVSIVDDAVNKAPFCLCLFCLDSLHLFFTTLRATACPFCVVGNCRLMTLLLPHSCTHNLHGAFSLSQCIGAHSLGAQNLRPLSKALPVDLLAGKRTHTHRASTYFLLCLGLFARHSRRLFYCQLAN